jgi:hypothetical protein
MHKENLRRVPVPATCPCASGLPVIAVRPGQDAEYAVARDLLGQPDARLPNILIQRQVADAMWCRACWPVKATRHG